jgi:hypothetical protein
MAEVFHISRTVYQFAVFLIFQQAREWKEADKLYS